MNKKNLLWTIVLLLGWGMSAQAQTHLFATPEGAGSANGLTWENAYTLTAALANANNNTIIHLKVGEYLLTAEITIPTGVQVIGGYEQTVRALIFPINLPQDTTATGFIPRCVPYCRATIPIV